MIKQEEKLSKKNEKFQNSTNKSMFNFTKYVLDLPDLNNIKINRTLKDRKEEVEEYIEQKRNPKPKSIFLNF